MPWLAPSWKAVIGLLSMLSGIITALTVTPGTLPRPIEAALVAAGAVLLAVERIADAMDNKVAASAPVPAPSPAAVPPVAP